MTESSRYLGLNDFVEQLAKGLQQAPLKKGYTSHEPFRNEVVETVKGVVKTILEPVGVSYQVWQGVAEPGGRGIAPTLAFSQEFIPDLVVEVGGLPTVAFQFHLLARLGQANRVISSALGEAILHSHQYPAVILFLHSPNGRIAPQGLLSREVILNMWSRHKVRVVFSP
jgi:hypothetical protein